MVSEQPPRDPRREYDDDFNEFFRKEYPRVVKSVMYAGAIFEEAEDAVVQAMILARTSWPLLIHPTAWVRIVALRLYFREVKKNRRRSDAETAAARLDCLDLGSVGPSGEPDEHSQVIAVLQCLPPAQRVVMALILDGYSPSEIAELLHLNPDTVRSNLRHARSRLRRELQDPAADERAVDDEKEKS